jgi:hypothetical protein
MGDQKFINSNSSNYSLCFERHVKLLVSAVSTPTRVVGYGPFSLYVIHKEGLCPSSGDNNTLMMMMMIVMIVVVHIVEVTSVVVRSLPLYRKNKYLYNSSFFTSLL